MHDGDPVVPFGTSPNDIIEFCLYDMDANYLASGELEFPLPTSLDVGAHVRSLGYERGNYQLKYNFLRRIGGSDKVVLTKKSDKSIFNGQYVMVEYLQVTHLHQILMYQWLTRMVNYPSC